MEGPDAMTDSPAPEPINEDDVEAATTIQVGVCGCPDVHVMFLDDAGELFAVGTFTPEQWAKVVFDVGTQLAAAGQGDAIGPCVGHG